MFPLMINFLKLIYNLLNEKEKRITENMRNMGMSLYKHYASWLTFNTLVLLSTTLTWAIITKIVIFKSSDFILVWWIMFLPALTLQSAAFFLTAFFTKAKSGIISGLVLLFLFDLARTAKQAITNPSEELLKWLSLSPPEGISATSSIVVLLESYSGGFQWDSVNSLVSGFKYSYFIQT